ncbi:hypothetical protein BC826DRAFT_475921 [Russula brevipes]|nr:hypothetical protein BC826DRAFT_475921 [Russula brevipes]
MDNFHDPHVIRRNFFYFLNLMHFMAGIYLWDFFTTMWFEWHCITGKRRFKWTLLLYSISRIGAVATAICIVLIFNIPHKINCQQLIIWTLVRSGKIFCHCHSLPWYAQIFGYTSFACVSVLIALRVIAIWSTNRFVVLLAIGMCLTNIGFLLYGITKVCSIWSPASGSCVLENTFRSRDNITVTVATDLAQLIIMVVGLLRSPRRKGSIARHLYNQGLIWLAAAMVAEVPSAVFINLNLNDAWNVMFQDFSFFVMVISATRIPQH